MWIGDSNRYFGWGEDKLLYQGVLWHNGGSAGFNSYLAFNKELRVGIILLSNYSFFTNVLMDYYVAQFIKWVIKKEPSQGTMVDTIGKRILEAILSSKSY